MANLTRRATLFTILSLAWPTVLEQALGTAVSYVDLAMVGHINSEAADAVAAIGSTVTVNWLINGSISALGVGFLAYIARECGAGRRASAAKAAAQAVLVTLVVGTLFTVLTLSLAGVIPVWMNADDAIVGAASRYFFILYTPTLLRTAAILFGTVLRAAGDTRTPMRVNLGVNLINVMLNFFLIFETRALTLFGLEFTVPGAGLGIEGAALASAASFAFGGVMMTINLFKHPTVSPRGLSIKPDREILAPCLKVALPAALQRFATSLGYVAFSSVINTLGAASTAAHSIANTAESAFYIPGYGMQTAAATLIGNAYGENNKEKMRTLTRTLIALELVVMAISGALLFTFAQGLMGLFTSDTKVIGIGTTVLRMVALSEPIYGVAVILEGIFQGVGDTKHAFYYNVLCMWGIRIVGTYICVCELGLDLTAAWACMIAHNMALGALLIWHYARGKWNPLSHESVNIS